MHYQSSKIALTGLLLATPILASEWAAVFYEKANCAGDPFYSTGGFKDSAGCQGVDAGAASVSIYKKSDSGPDREYDIDIWIAGGCPGKPDGGGQPTEDEGCINAGENGETWGSIQVTSSTS